MEALVKPLDLNGVTVIRIDDTGAAGDPYEDFIARALRTRASLDRGRDGDALINYTSGTTGRPKGVMIHHRGAYLNADQRDDRDAGQLRHEVPVDAAMFHCNGWCYTWGVTAMAGTHVCLRRVDPGEDLGAHRQRGHHALLRRADRADRHRQRPSCAPSRPHVTAGVAGARPLADAARPHEGPRLPAVHLYGLTETYGPHTVCSWNTEWDARPTEDQARLAARQGQAFVLADLVRVVDEKMNDVPMNAEVLGEVVMRGNNVMKGYYEQPDATAGGVPGRWFHSGDIAVWHPDGYVELRDRKKDIIISGGENISTIEVEQAVAKHPAVMECAVVAVPDEKWGERPKAFVTLKPGQRATEAEIIEFCRQYIAHFKCPASIEFGDLAQDVHGQGAEVRAARQGVEGSGEAHQLIRLR
jgi:fatty-acyl-CoA synthase